MKLDRLVSILVLLLRKEKVRAKELAELFEVSVRTIYRDIEAINLAGIPIVTYQGVNGGIGIAEGYRLDKSVLTEDEMSTIVSTLNGIATTMPDKKYEIIMEKIRNTIPSKQLENMDSKVKQLIIDFFPWGSGKFLKESVSIIKKAIENHNLIQFNYIDYSANKTIRIVEPYSLVLKNQSWYLHAWCQIRQDLRVFKLSRIREMTALKQKFVPRKIEFDHLNFDTAWKYTGKTVTLQLLFDGEIENIAFEFFGDSLKKQNDGKLLLKTEMPEGYWLYGFILSFGTGVEVIHPPHVRDAFGRYIKKYIQKIFLRRTMTYRCHVLADILKKKLKEAILMDYQITLKQQASQPVLSIRKTTSLSKLSEEIGKAYGMIAMYMQEMGEEPKEAPFTAYYNMDMENLDVEMGFPVSKPMAGRGEIKAAEIPEGKYVEGMYKGSFSGISSAYDAISAWINEKGLTPTGAAYEYYFNTPGEVPDSELLTKIVFPVK